MGWHSLRPARTIPLDPHRSPPTEIDTMTRITLAAVLLALAGSAQAQGDLPLDKRTYTDAKGKVLPYRLLKPADYDAKQKYPLVLFLHGAGERGDDNEKQLVHGIADFVKRQKEYPCFLI